MHHQTHMCSVFSEKARVPVWPWCRQQTAWLTLVDTDEFSACSQGQCVSDKGRKV